MSESQALGSAPPAPIGEGDHVRGEGAEAILYLDLACPRCAGAWEGIRRLPLRLCVRHFPIASKRPRATALHAATEAAALQSEEAFWELWDALLADRSRTDDPHLWSQAERLGLSVERFDRDRRSEAVARRVRDDFLGGIRAGVTATPTAFVGGEAVRGELPGALEAASVRIRARGARGVALALAATVLALAAPGSAAADLPPGFADSVVFDGLKQPTAVTVAPDGTIFVTEKRGRVLSFSGRTDRNPTVVANLEQAVHSFDERGLTGIEVDPAYPKSPFIYVSYTLNAPLGAPAPFWGLNVKRNDLGEEEACLGGIPDLGYKRGCVVSSRVSRFPINKKRQGRP